MASFNSFVTWVQASPTIQSAVSLADNLGKFAIVFALFSYLYEYPDRQKQRYFQAWQVINSARNSSGDGGRRAAIVDLISEGIDLRLIDMSYAGVEHFDFRGANMPDAKFNNAVILDTKFGCRSSWLLGWIPSIGACTNTIMTRSFFGSDTVSIGTNPQSLTGTATKDSSSIIEDSDFSNAQMNSAILQSSLLHRNSFENADLSDSFFSSITFAGGNSFKGAHLERAHFSHMGFRAVKAAETVNLDFTDAILNDATLDGKLLSPEALTKDVVKLCRTRFSASQTSNRDC